MTPRLGRTLFPWDELADAPSLHALYALLASIPDQRLLHLLDQRRHHGCDTYAVRVLGGCLRLAILLRYPCMQACLHELRPNAGLRLLLDLQREQDVPHGWNLSRFLAVVGQQPFPSEWVALFDALVRHLGQTIADLGRHTAGDATALSGRPEADDDRRVEGFLCAAEKRCNAGTS